MNTALLGRVAMVAVFALLVAAVVSQRATVVDAVAELRTLSAGAIAILAVLAGLDRLLRAEVIRSLLPTVSLGRAEVISDVGAAATKGVPLGGPVGTVLRWQIAKERKVDAVGFVSMLVATGVAAAFTSWGLALAAVLADIPGRSVTRVDVILVATGVTMLGGALLFWASVLGTEIARRWMVGRSAWVCNRFSTVVPGLAATDPEAFVADLWTSLRALAHRPIPLLVRTVMAQVNGFAVLWVGLLALGGGLEPTITEFAKVFFVTHILGSMLPTPGGIGFMELGLTGALVAIGIDPATALAAVLIYRFVTYLLPILIGTALFGAWRHRRRAEAARPVENNWLIAPDVLHVGMAQPSDVERVAQRR